MVAGSGLADVLAHVNILEMQLKLFTKRIQVLGCCSDFAFGTKLYFRAGRALALIGVDPARFVITSVGFFIAQVSHRVSLCATPLFCQLYYCLYFAFRY